jgi:hypothetical protein
MNPEFKNWLENQIYTLTSIGWTYKWDDIIDIKYCTSGTEHKWRLWGPRKQV